MEHVTVKKSQLLEIVKTNAEQHRKNYEDAVNGYQEECLAALEREAGKLRAVRTHVVVIQEHPPENHYADYECAIDMLEMSTEEEVLLQEHEFRQLVRDEWQWKRNWSEMNTKYLIAASLKRP